MVCAKSLLGANPAVFRVIEKNARISNAKSSVTVRVPVVGGSPAEAGRVTVTVRDSDSDVTVDSA